VPSRTAGESNPISPSHPRGQPGPAAAGAAARADVSALRGRDAEADADAADADAAATAAANNDAATADASPAAADPPLGWHAPAGGAAAAVDVAAPLAAKEEDGPFPDPIPCCASPPGALVLLLEEVATAVHASDSLPATLAVGKTTCAPEPPSASTHDEPAGASPWPPTNSPSSTPLSRHVLPAAAAADAVDGG
jgi:hypothetical protein